MNISVSVGELLDKLSILELKKNIIKDENKLVEIEKEIQVLSAFDYVKNENLFYYNILKWINQQIWYFTDTIKASKELNENFATLSNKIFNYNQYRFRVKNMLNSKSEIKEQKSYTCNNIKVKIDFNSFYSNLTKINKLSVLYDSVIFSTNDNELISNIYPTSNFSFCNDDDAICINEIVLSDFNDVDVFEFPSINYISGGLLGDFIHQLSVCNETFLKSGRKANIYITNHNLEGFSLGVERAHADLSPILSKQKYINSFELYTGQDCPINLSIWRHSHLLYRLNWYHIFLDKYGVEWAKHKWINADVCDEFKDVIFLNVSMSRYVSHNYNKICPGKKIIFICFNKNEYDGFSSLSGTSFPFYIAKDIDDMFKSIASCYCFIGNLSSPLAFAISMHKYCIGLIGETVDTIHMKDLQIPNYHYYQNENSFTKNVFNF